MAGRRASRADVLYDPTDPTNARIDTFFELWGAPLLSAVLGFFFLACGVYLFTTRTDSWLPDAHPHYD